jgi:hypothetical protein
VTSGFSLGSPLFNEMLVLCSIKSHSRFFFSRLWLLDPFGSSFATAPAARPHHHRSVHRSFTMKIQLLLAAAVCIIHTSFAFQPAPSKSIRHKKCHQTGLFAKKSDEKDVISDFCQGTNEFWYVDVLPPPCNTSFGGLNYYL